MKRYNTTTNGYRYDKLIFYGILAIYFLFIFLLAYKNNFDFSNKIYFKCVGYEPCPNPLYKQKLECNRAWLYGEDCNVKKEEWFYLKDLPPGEYGTKQPDYLKYVLPSLFILFVLGLLLNHFLHNRGKTPEIEIVLTKNRKININNVLDKFGKNLEEENEEVKK